MKIPIQSRMDILRWSVYGILLLVSSLFLWHLANPEPQTKPAAVSTVQNGEVLGAYDSANAVTAGMSLASIELSRSMASTEVAMANSSRAATTAMLHTGESLVDGATTTTSFVANTATTTATMLARTASSSMAALVRLPSIVFGSASDTKVVRAIIKPAGGGSVPTIDPDTINALTRQAGTAPVAPAGQAASATAPTTVWPMHGDVTTLFGVPHWPYQPLHTGLDISDGHGSGVTPIKSFRAGRVIYTQYSYSGLGNYVIVDHGEGVTSVYAHLATIAVQTGQAVDTTTVLGTQGSTGASTGPHLHFEIRINGIVTDPIAFIGSRP